MKSLAVLLAACSLAVGLGSPVYDGDDTSEYDRAPPREMPRNIKLKFNKDNQQVKLNLVKNNHVPSDVVTIIGRNGDLARWTNTRSKNFAVYQDTESHASFVVEDRSTSGGSTKQHIHGFFRVNTTDYQMSAEKAVPRHTPTSLFLGLLPATLPLESDEIITLQNADVSAVEINSDALEDLVMERGIPSGRKFEDARLDESERNYNSGPRVYGVEMFMVLDYAIYNRFYEASKGRTSEEKENDAIYSIRHYFAHVVNGVDLRYATIRGDFEIYVKLVGYYIATTARDSPWTETYPIKQAGHFSEAYLALDSLEAWISEKNDSLPYFDQVTLFSGNKLFNGHRNDGTRRTFAGLANIKGICTQYKTSINHDAGEYASIQTAAHELGHNLGAYHDGTANGCTGRDQYMMASSPAKLKENNFYNPFRFSECSLQYFREYLFHLDKIGENCLVNSADHGPGNEIDSHLRKPPGQRFNPDEQCRLLYGYRSVYCGGGTRDSKICSEMRCWDPDKNACHSTVEQRAFEKTTCGNQKWCVKGKCESESEAPSAKESCIYGDYKGTLPSLKQTCEQLIKENPAQCYKEFIRQECCIACAEIRDDSKPGCQYGDEQSDYCRKITASGCYQESTRTSCCATCGKFNTGQPECEYGDKANWCSSISSDRCYAEGNVCCKACSKHKSGPEGCEFGDKVRWCGTLKSRDCYDSNNLDLCCNTCLAKHTAVKGCEYGDRDGYCTKQDCSDPSRKTECCHTCPSENGPESDCQDKATFCSSMPTSNCYGYDETCCQTCRRHKTQKQGCEYGDHVTWCSDYVTRPGDCQTGSVGSDCCKTCSEITDTETSGEECRDEASWCPSIFAGQCYTRTTADTCCAQCKFHKTGQRGCEYGDKYSWCRSDYCGSSARDCCKTCDT